MAAEQEEIRRLKNEIELAGGERLRQIPLLIEQNQWRAKTAREEYARYEAAHRQAMVGNWRHDSAHFEKLQQRVPALLAEVAHETVTRQQQRDQLVLQRGTIHQAIDNDRQELESLRNRQGNLPRHLIDLRGQICADLRLPHSDLPYAAELVCRRT